MKITKPSVNVLTSADSITEQLKIVELAARNCYKSEDKICEGSYNKIIAMLMMKKHHSVSEHGSITVRFTGSRAMSHQLVRHRLAAYSQSSQRYCNYSKGKFGSEITFVEPIGFNEWSEVVRNLFTKSLQDSEDSYLECIRLKLKPEDARGVLPNQTMTEVVTTMNFRSWRHFFEMRCDPHAQAEIRVLAKDLLVQFKKLAPVMFNDLNF